MNYLKNRLFIKESVNLLNLLLILFCLPLSIFGQTETGGIIGVVTDAAGKVIPGAIITINFPTGAKYPTSTDEDGNYKIINLLPGSYDVEVNAESFEKKRQRIKVDVGSTSNLNFELSVSAVRDTTLVTASEPQNDTFTSNIIKQLPTISRTPYEIVALAGNISSNVSKSVISTDAVLTSPIGRGVGFNINGLRASSTTILLDGADNSNNFSSSVGQQVPLDSLQEFTVVKNQFSPEFSKPFGSGTINIVTKNGTNEYHGSAFIFNRNDKFASNTFDNNAQNIERGNFSRNLLGITLGGPIKKNRLFFFSSGEFLKVRSRQDTLFYVPSESFINTLDTAVQTFFGTFPLKNPTPINGSAITGNNLNTIFGLSPSTIANIGGLGKAIFKKVSTPLNIDVGGDDPQDTYRLVNRIDYQINNKLLFYSRYAFENADLYRGTNSSSPYQNATGSDFDTGTKLHSNNMLFSVLTYGEKISSQFKFVFNRLTNDQPINNNQGADDIFTPSLYATPRPIRINGIPLVFPGYFPLSPGRPLPFIGSLDTSQLYADVSYTIGNHSLRAGGSFIHQTDDRTSAIFGNGTQILGVNLSDALTGLTANQLFSYTVAVAPNGLPRNDKLLQVTSPNFHRNLKFNDLAFYFNDSWKPFNNITLELGIRYDNYGVQKRTDTSAGQSNFQFGPGDNIFEKIRSGNLIINNEPYAPDNNNFAPRIGIALDLFGNGKTVLRGGYGVSYDRVFNNITFNLIQNPPEFAVVTFGGSPARISVKNFGPIDTTKTVPISSNIAAVNLRQIDTNLKTSYIHSWNATITQLLSNNLTVSASYTGTKGVDLYSLDNINRPRSGVVYLKDDENLLGGRARLNQTFGDISILDNLGDSIYHSLNLQIIANNLANTGLDIRANYTYSHAIDNISSILSESENNLNVGLLNPFEPSLDRGNADFDIRHRFVTSGIWIIPFAKKTTGLTKKVFDGWNLSFLFAANTGFPFSVYDCRSRETNPALLSFTCGRITNMGNLSINAMPNTDVPNLINLLDLSKFNSTPINDELSFSPSMTPRNFFHGPGKYNLDMGLAKTVTIKEKYQVQFFAEFFNIFNHSNLFLIGSQADVSSSNFVPAKRDGRRQIEFSLRVEF